MSVADLARTRFAFSPLAEVAESLYMLNSGAAHPLHRSWFDRVQPGLDHVDLELLHAVVPARPLIADFLFAGAPDPTTTIEQQLKLVARLAPGAVGGERGEGGRGDPRRGPARPLIALGRDGPPHLAEALGRYWLVAIEPHWQAMRAVLDDDVAFRATELTRGGV